MIFFQIVSQVIKTTAIKGKQLSTYDSLSCQTLALSNDLLLPNDSKLTYNLWFVFMMCFFAQLCLYVVFCMM